MSGERARATRRWRRSRSRYGGGPPLPRRRTDRVEDLVAWLLTSLGLLAVLGSVLVGQAARHAALGQAGPASEVRAVLLTDATRGPEAGRRVPAPHSHASVTWTGADGVAHVASVSVPVALQVDSVVTLWVDGAGRVVPDPVQRSAEAWAFGISAGLTAVTLSWALLTLAWSAVRRVTAARNAAGWAREWARVEPRWRRSVR